MTNNLIVIQLKKILGVVISYDTRLRDNIKSGIATNFAYDKIKLALPLFKDYIRKYYI